jgi:microsomal dipeptidase-like Zn-dependent dipeptidase
MIPIIDLHCHPSMKIYLCNNDITREHHPAPDVVLPTGMHVDLPGMQESGVKVIFTIHHIPEADLLKTPKSQKLVRLLQRLKIKMLEKLEPDKDGDACMELVRQSISLLEGQIASPAAAQFNVVIARDLASFNSAWQQEKTIIVHCMEGAHPLGRNLPSPADYVRNLLALKEKGLCILTLAHFFKNGLCDSGGGIPPSTANALGYSREFIDPGGLTPAGEAVVQECFEKGIVIDLTHSTIKTRKRVYAILRERAKGGKVKRPVIFTHTGIREVSDPNMTDPNDRLLLPDREEIQTIKEFDGVFGMILMNYWTHGVEEGSPLTYDVGIPYVIETIKFIAEVTGSFDHIAIGTDLDGLSQTPGDVAHVRHMGKLRNAVLNEFGEKAAAKICFENALRVIRAGWS